MSRRTKYTADYIYLFAYINFGLQCVPIFMLSSHLNSN